MTRSAGGRSAATGSLVVLLMAASAASAEVHERFTADDPETQTARAEPEEHGPLVLAIDAVIGFGRYPLFLPLRTPMQSSGFSSVGYVAVSSQSLLVAGSYEIAEQIALGVRLPLSLGDVPLSDGSTRSVFALGNVELEVESEQVLDETTTLILSLGVSLPTAEGREEPGLEDPSGSVSLYERFMVNRIAASSRGFEDNALFELERIGVIPKLALRYHADRVLLAPFIKLENLLATSLHPERRFIAEIVIGSLFAYELSEHFEIGARVWLTTSVADNVRALGVVEPQLRGHFAPLDVVLGGIVPFVGELTHPQFAGLRLSVSARL
jgi:hypothetical protein